MAASLRSVNVNPQMSRLVARGLNVDLATGVSQSRRPRIEGREREMAWSRHDDRAAADALPGIVCDTAEFHCLLMAANATTELHSQRGSSQSLSEAAEVAAIVIQR